MTSGVGFHRGELAVQQQAGVADLAARLSPMVERGELRGGVGMVLAAAPFAAAAARDDDGRLWISPLFGPPGFLEAGGPSHLSVRDGLRPGDPLYGLALGQPVGLVAMVAVAKRRVRINGTVSAVNAGSFDVDVVQAYGNCPQYITPRKPAEQVGSETVSVDRYATLTADDIAFIRAADTFYLGTTHVSGNDASHRGGAQGFVEADENTVVWPDYAGNNMFNSLGNIALDPTAALLFVDVRTGRSLQLSGQARIEWDAPGDTGRQVRFTVEAVLSRK